MAEFITAAVVPPPLPPKTRRSPPDAVPPATVLLPTASTTTNAPSSASSSSSSSQCCSSSAYATSSSSCASSPDVCFASCAGSHVVKIRINPSSSDNVSLCDTACIRINLNTTAGSSSSSSSGSSDGTASPASAAPEEMIPAERAYFYYMSSGQVSPSDTLDSGTCSDLDSTPSPMLPPTTTNSKKSVSVTVIGATTAPDSQPQEHKRAPSLTSSGADAESDDDESNISCDSLNSGEEMLHVHQALPQGLLHDIRERSTVAFGADVVGVMPKISFDAELLAQTKIILENDAIDRNPPNLSDNDEEEEVEVEPARIVVKESTYEERQLLATARTYDSDKFISFHLNEAVAEDKLAPLRKQNLSDAHEDESFAGYKDLLQCEGSATIRSAKGTIRGVKNRVRAGIATFLNINDHSKTYKEKDAGKIVVYTTTMGIVRDTYFACMKVKQILRTQLVRFEERDVFMSTDYQAEIRDRMRCNDILVPQVFVDGQHIGDAETIEKLNESGELRRILKPYKTMDACSTCQMCGGYNLLPCPVCNGSKKSVHRNHFTAEFVALKCMNCDEVGLVKCTNCAL